MFTDNEKNVIPEIKNSQNNFSALNYMNEDQIKLISERLKVDKKFFDIWKSKLKIKKYKKIGEIILNINSVSDSVLLLVEGKSKTKGYFFK